ncbi:MULTISPECIES: NusG domain II-containing protein [Furfurilactobacillus]|nr:NusG domain II-containing protein [Furfurilactobacillus rossiae]MCF6166776.1 NusG domain II-containing protein [Furfurilactobacillus rossiae]MYV05297.1 NusG domain II-containing protein [Furfurilactobacillus milii]MYV16950.1 NusG domain II-containing protein [Furfurilactobacillus milii]QFR65648.1 NusG domain II-containing protein [Furfurilactobacillus rossiae]
MKLSPTVKRYLKMIRPFDIIIVTLLIIGSFIPLMVFTTSQHHQAAAQTTAKSHEVYTAVVSHNGHVLKRIRLTGHQGKTRYHFTMGHGAYNDTLVTDNRIQISDANCPDQICVHHSAISKPGQTIVCLPHKVLVEVKSSNGATHSNSTGGLVKP